MLAAYQYHGSHRADDTFPGPIEPPRPPPATPELRTAPATGRSLVLAALVAGAIGGAVSAAGMQLLNDDVAAVAVSAVPAQGVYTAAAPLPISTGPDPPPPPSVNAARPAAPSDPAHATPLSDMPMPPPRAAAPAAGAYPSGAAAGTPPDDDTDPPAPTTTAAAAAPRPARTDDDKGQAQTSDPTVRDVPAQARSRTTTESTDPDPTTSTRARTAPAPMPGTRTCSTTLAGAEPHAARAGNHLRIRFGIPTSEIGGKRDRAVDPDGHPKGLALDFGADRATGDRLATYAVTHRAELGVVYVIWRQRISIDGGPFRLMTDRGTDRDNHFDHVHVSFTADPPPNKPLTC